MESEDQFSVDEIQFAYPIKLFDAAIDTRDDAKLVALISEWFGSDEESVVPEEYFHRAVEVGMRPAIRELAKNSTLVRSNYGNLLPVQLAVFCEDLETLDLLIELGANIDETVDAGPTAAFIPVVTDNLSLLKALQQRGADLQRSYVLPDGTSRSLFELAKLLQRTEIMRFLQQLHIDDTSNQSDEQVECDFYVLAAWGQTFLEKKLLSEAISWFKIHPMVLEQDAGILIEAAEKGQLELIQAYVDAGADVNAFDFSSGTALAAAAAENQIEAAQLLIQLGADLEVCDDSMPMTALFKAVSNGHEEMARLLLKHNANPNAMFLTWSCQPRNCLEFLQSRDLQATELYQMLVDHGAKLPTLIEMVETYPEQAMSIAEQVLSAENYAGTIELTSHLIEKRPESMLHYCRGVAFDMTEQRDKALADFDTAIVLDPENFQALYSRALVQRNLGRWQESLADLEAAIILNPSDYITANALASSLLHAPNENMLDPKRAVKLATEAAELSDWDDALCVETLAEAYRAIGEETLAVEMEQKAAELREYDY